MNLLPKALGLPTGRSQGVTPYVLGSFRPGGATFLLQLFEDADFVRRIGRWVSAKVLEVPIEVERPHKRFIWQTSIYINLPLWQLALPGEL